LKKWRFDTMKLGKKGKGGGIPPVFQLGGVFLVVLLIYGVFAGQIKIPGLASVAPGAVSDFSDAVCDSDDGLTTLTLSVQNLLNTTGVSTNDMGIRFYGDGEVVSGTDTTAGSYTLNCPGDYIVKGISASGALGDAATFGAVKTGDATDNGDGTSTIRIRKAAQTVVLGGYVHDNIEMRAKDIVNDGFMFDSAENAATDYDTDGVNFTGTVDNDTETAVGSGGEFHQVLYFRPTSGSISVFGDIGGIYYLIDAPTTAWNTPTVKFNGLLLTEISDQLNADEKKAYTGYEFVYKSEGYVTQQKEGILDFQVFALSGVNPVIATDNIQIDLASRGQYASNSDSNVLKVGSVQDDTSQTVVHTLMDTFFVVS